MPLNIIRAGLADMQSEIIVSSASPNMNPDGGGEYFLHKKAGPKLQTECSMLAPLKSGQPVITSAGNLKAKKVIHILVPKWDHSVKSEEQLVECYEKSMRMAVAKGYRSIAFGLLGSGARGFPKEIAFRIALDSIQHFLMEEDLDVTLVLYDSNSVQVSDRLFSQIASYIDDHYVDKQQQNLNLRESVRLYSPASELDEIQKFSVPSDYSVGAVLDLEGVLEEGETFSEMLLRLIDARGEKDSDVYKKAGKDRKLFSKIRSNPRYQPRKNTVLSFCLALELDISQSNELLQSAGFALSPANKGDLIVEYCIKNKIYNVMKVNAALSEFDQPLL